MKTQKNVLLAAAVLGCLVAQSLGAQTATRNGYYTKTLGNEWMGGELFAGAAFQATRTPDPLTPIRDKSYAFGALNFDARVRLIQQTLTLASMSTLVRSQTYGTSLNEASFSLYVRGIVERNQRFTTPGVHSPLYFYKTFDLFPVDPSTTVSVYGYPVRVWGNIGVGVESSLNLTVGSGRAGIGALGRAWGYGFVKAKAGWDSFGAGVDFYATFANTRLEPSIFADARNILNGGPAQPSITGRIKMTFQAIALKIVVWVAVIFRGTKTLVNWASNPVTLLDILF